MQRRSSTTGTLDKGGAVEVQPVFASFKPMVVSRQEAQMRAVLPSGDPPSDASNNVVGSLRILEVPSLQG